LPESRRRHPPFAEHGLRFDIGRHVLRLMQGAAGWSASVDGLPSGGSYASQAEAWQAGVRAALALEGPAPRGGGAAGRGPAPQGEGSRGGRSSAK
jgi:hypothetical protein